MNKTIYINADDFGRSELISKNILKTIESGMINSVSIMVDEDEKYYKILKNYNVKKKLHVNLTDYRPNHKFEDSNVLLKNLTFFKLLFLKKKYRNIVFHEIDRQIKLYVDYFEINELIIDGHQHIHVIPWIYNYLFKYEKYKIIEIRLPKEKFFIGDIKSFLKLKFYRNIVAYILLNIIIRFFLKEKIFSPRYSGMIYSGIYNETIFINNYRFMKKRFSSFEIAFHPGFTTYEEQDEFYDLFFKYYSSEDRKNEFRLAMKKMF